MLEKTLKWIKERPVKELLFMLVCIFILMFSSYGYSSLPNKDMIIASPFIAIVIYTGLIYGMGKWLKGDATFKEVLTLQTLIKVLEIIINMSILSLISVLKANASILIIISAIIQIGLLIFNVVLVGKLENVDIKKAIQISIIVIFVSLIVIGNTSYKSWIANETISQMKQLTTDVSNLQSQVDELQKKTTDLQIQN